jgi:hypothetical protein
MWCRERRDLHRQSDEQSRQRATRVRLENMHNHQNRGNTGFCRACSTHLPTMHRVKGNLFSELLGKPHLGTGAVPRGVAEWPRDAEPQRDHTIPAHSDAHPAGSAAGGGLGAGICPLVVASIRAAGGCGRTLAPVDAPLCEAGRAQACARAEREQPSKPPVLDPAPAAEQSAARRLVESREVSARPPSAGRDIADPGPSRADTDARARCLRNRRSPGDLFDGARA